MFSFILIGLLNHYDIELIDIPEWVFWLLFSVYVVISFIRCALIFLKD